MSVLASELISRLTLRMRQPTAISEALFREVASHSQRLIAAGTRAVYDTAVLTTQRQRQIYSIAALLPNAVLVEGVRDGARDLPFVPWRSLAQSDRSWHRRVEAQHEVWSLMGRDLLIIHPARDDDSSVTVYFRKMTAELENNNVLTEVPDDLVPAVLDFAEAVLLVRERRLDVAEATLDRLVRRLKVESVKGNRP